MAGVMELLERAARFTKKDEVDEGRQLRDAFPDVDAASLETLRAVRSHTMTSPERVFALIDAVRYVVRRKIPGAIVECGVWRGGSMMAVARTLASLGDASRELYLFDTFDGMPPPGEHDVDVRGTTARDALAKSSRADASSVWCIATIEDVQQALGTVDYPRARLHLVKGRVEQTVPTEAPGEIALLRLDTDWYESTRHELEHLYPRLSKGGVLIIDDYGHWKGSRRATDEFIAATPEFGLLSRIDTTGRLAIKM
jgi:O-methyltransferase